MTWRLSSSMHVQYEDALQSFFHIHDLVFTHGFVSSQFLDHQHATFSIKNHHKQFLSISAPSQQKIYSGIHTIEKLQSISSINDLIIEYQIFSHGSLKKSINSPKNNPNKATQPHISFFIEGDFFVWSDTIKVLIWYFHRFVTTKQIATLTEPVSINALQTKDFFAHLAQHNQTLLGSAYKIIEESSPLLIAYNDSSTTIESIQRPTQLGLFITTSPFPTFPDMQQTDTLHSAIETLVSILQRNQKQSNRLLDARSIQGVATTLETIRHSILMQANRMHQSVFTLQEREQTINKQIHNSCTMIIIPQGNFLYRYFLPIDGSPIDRISNKIIACIQTLNNDISILHNRVTHGMRSPGKKCQQRLSQGIVHEYSPQITAIKTTKDDRKYIDHDTIDYSQGIILDARNNKVLINGQSFTSTDLPSQKSIVEIIGTLITHYGDQIQNIELPASSYAKNKNNLIGKVIAPLQKVVKKHLGTKLHIHTQGGLYDYALSLPKQRLSITFIKKNG